ncbi:TonB-dependent receptor [Sphingomonas morindae]|uniref:TonB-dependent receptor n=1 Tax=Sphingomonas morindae TaxID=1541170 RepID=A0ABY4X7W4_9SPHN|nr:TonB-dependent receptor [Sphingomonas morindae]USI72986.1 TonB-dependent receptor [Sphingomonas morindae]
MGPSGETIAGAEVRVRSEAQGFTRVTVTRSDGSYSINSLPPGRYTVTVTAPGFQPLQRAGVDLSSGQSANSFRLAALEGQGQAILVTAGRRQVLDFTSTATGAALEISDLSRRLPLGRSLTDAILLAPGTTPGDSAFGNLASVTGSSVSENQFYVNGLNITSFHKGLGSATVPYDFYQTVDVRNGGYSAEFGRATGGLTIATTKSGSNRWHAGSIFTIEPDFVNALAPNTYAADNDAYKSEHFEAYFYGSGPIIKDRLFFYAFANPRDVRSGGGSLAANSYYEGVGKVTFWGGKIDAIPLDGHRLEFTYFDTSGPGRSSSRRYDPNTNALGAITSRRTSDGIGRNFVGRYTAALSHWLSLSGAYGESKQGGTSMPTNLLPPVTDQRSGTARTIGNPDAGIASAIQHRRFYRFDGDLDFSLLGHHHVRAGLDHEDLDVTVRGEVTGGASWTYYKAGEKNRYAPRGTEFAAGRVYTNNGRFRTVNQAFYVEDSWSMLHDRVTLRLGLRDDRFENRNVAGKTFYTSGDQFGPRIGLTVDPFGDKRTKLYATFSRFFLPIPTNTNARLAGAELDYTRCYALAGVNADGTPILGDPLAFSGARADCPGSTARNCRLIGDGSPKPTEAVVSQSLKPQSVDEFIVGAEHRLDQHLRLGLYATYRTLNRSLEDAAIDLAVLRYCTRNGIEGCDDIWSGFHQYVLLNPGSDARITLSNPIAGESGLRTVDFSAGDLGYPKAKRTYFGVTATLDRDWDGRFELHGSYVWSKNKGNIEGGVKSDNGQTDSGLTEDFDQPGLTNGSYGYLPNDRRHVFKLYGAYQLLPKFRLGFDFSASSPRRFGCIGLVPDEVDPFANAYGAAGRYCRLANGQLDAKNPVVLVPRATAFKSDWVTRLDASLTFLPRPKNEDLAVQISVFNLFNQHAVVTRSEYGSDGSGEPTRTYRLPTEYQSPRSARLTVRLGF